MMKQAFSFFLAILASLVFVSFASALVSTSYEVTLSDFTGDDAEVLLKITGDGTNAITFAVDVIAPDFADIRALFFNFDNSPLPGDIQVTGTDVTYFSFVEDGVQNLGGGATISPKGPFDGGVEIGTSGASPDDFYSTSFTVTSTVALVLGEQFAARLTSVGDTEQSRGGSSKLVGNYDPTTPPPPQPPAVPEPGTMVLLGFGLALVGVNARRIRTKK